ncbi:hypothetical protein [Alicyclobacillus sp. SO9]|uniref:hypothetical protein n=1 Tax=Alicyclobacillus sp. SO9 TaxID=2665646 RepID=UPI0018E77125|nr:hypothetical protein [Alicyclobacillus sp. SO9]QQE79478.1 hypothetical protein GI364_02985 [Alicyclobacillus sp. SO9]
MWEMMNGMTNGVRNRFMPRRRNNMGTMTAMLVGASVGIAAWEAMRRGNVTSRINNRAQSMAQDNAEQIAEKVMNQLDDEE